MVKEQTLAERIEEYNNLAHFLAHTCVRNNTSLENIHAGHYPISKTGDYSDVRVVDGIGNEITWNDLSRISDAEMRVFNKQVVNNIFSMLFLLKDITLLGPILNRATLPPKWDYAELDNALIKAVLSFAAMAEESGIDRQAMEEIIDAINRKTRDLR